MKRRGSPGVPCDIPGQSLSHTVFGDAMVAKKDFTAAVPHGAPLAPRAFEPHLKLGQVYVELGYMDEAQQRLRQAMALSPGNPDVLYWWGSFLYAQGDTKTPGKHGRKRWNTGL